MRFSRSVRRYLPAVAAVLLSLCHSESFAFAAGPIAIECAPGIDPADQLFVPGDQPSPNRPEGVDTPISPIGDNSADDPACEAGRYDIEYKRLSSTPALPAAFILPRPPAVASRAFQITPIYRSTQRFRL
ncbi:MAG: hypothetical protein P8178_09355 [Candidatus Thiodiazotropha sp.]